MCERDKYGREAELWRMEKGVEGVWRACAYMRPSSVDTRGTFVSGHDSERSLQPSKSFCDSELTLALIFSCSMAHTVGEIEKGCARERAMFGRVTPAGERPESRVSYV